MSLTTREGSLLFPVPSFSTVQSKVQDPSPQRIEGKHSDVEIREAGVDLISV